MASNATTKQQSPVPHNTLGLVTFAICIMVFFALALPARFTHETIQGGVAPTASYPYTLYNATDAISLTLRWFPPGHNPQSPVARLISRDALDQWRGVITSHDNPHSPVWLVGVQDSGLQVKDLAVSDLVADTTPIDGAFYAWDANAGFLLGNGALGSAWPQTYLSIAHMQNGSWTITTATPFATQTMPSPPGLGTPGN